MIFVFQNIFQEFPAMKIDWPLIKGRFIGRLNRFKTLVAGSEKFNLHPNVWNAAWMVGVLIFFPFFSVKCFFKVKLQFIL